MSIYEYIHRIRNFGKSNEGNFGVMIAVLLPILVGVTGVAIDFTGMMNARAKMRNASDAGALAASSAMAEKNATEDQAREIVMRYLKAHSEPDFDFSSGASVSIVTTAPPSTKSYKVTVNTTFDYRLNPMTAFLGFESKPISASSTSISSPVVVTALNPVSLYLVLDRSGSMSFPTEEVIGTDSRGRPVYRTKIESLKIAVGKLSDILKARDPDWKYVRTGSIAYSTFAFAPTNMEWGTSTTIRYADALVAHGSTNPVEAIDKARELLIAPSENAAHLAKNGSLPEKSILFLTDGANNPDYLDAPAQANCTAAKRAGLEIYTIGFMVPPEAYSFLSACATDADHFFDVTTAAGLYAVFEDIGAKTSTKMTNRIED